MKSLPRELEIKLALTSEQTRRLIARIRAASPSTVKSSALRSTYFDTQDWSLQAEGFSLRIRRTDDVLIQTLKAEKTMAGGVSNSIELETVVDTAQPAIIAIENKRLRRKIENLVRASPLEPLFETIVDRSSMLVTTVGGDEIEVALDIGVVRAGRRETKLREAELELKSGDPAALMKLVHEITGDGPVRPGLLTKSDRGYRLLGWKPMADITAAKGVAPAIVPGMTSGAAFSEILRVVTTHVLHNWRLLELKSDADAVHQLRVGLRRLRAALRILRTVVDDEKMRALDVTARDLARIAARLRDVDALISDIVEPVDCAASISLDVDILQRRLARERKSRSADVLEALEHSRFSSFRIEMGLLPRFVDRAIDANPKVFLRPVEDLARDALRKLLRRVRRYASNLSSLSIEERHALRKAIKPFRYGVEFFAPLYRRAKTQRLLTCASQLQATLGYLNDVALAETLVAMDWPSDERETDAARAIGAVVGWHTAKAENAWSEVKSTWKQFERAAQFLE